MWTGLNWDILGDPGAVSRIERKGGTKVFKYGRKSRYRLSPKYFQKFKRMPAPDWAQKMLCIIVPNRRTVSPELFLWVRTRRLLSRHTFPLHVRARETFTLYFPNQKERNYRWVAKTFGMLSAGAIEFAPSILFLTDHNVSSIIGS